MKSVHKLLKLHKTLGARGNVSGYIDVRLRKEEGVGVGDAVFLQA